MGGRQAGLGKHASLGQASDRNLGSYLMLLKLERIFQSFSGTSGLGPAASPPVKPGEIQTFPPLLVSHWLITNATWLELALKCYPQAVSDWVNLLFVRDPLHAELPHLFSFLSL